MTEYQTEEYVISPHWGPVPILNPFWHVEMIGHCVAAYFPWVPLLVICIIVHRLFLGTEFGEVVLSIGTLAMVLGWIALPALMTNPYLTGEARRLAGIGLLLLILDFCGLLFGWAYGVYPLLMKHVESPRALAFSPAYSKFLTHYIKTTPRVRATLQKLDMAEIRSTCSDCRFGWELYHVLHYELQYVWPKAIFGAPYEEGASSDREYIRQTNTVYWMHEPWGYFPYALDGGDGYPRIGYTIVLDGGRATVYLEPDGDQSFARTDLESAVDNAAQVLDSPIYQTTAAYAIQYAKDRVAYRLVIRPHNH